MEARLELNPAVVQCALTVQFLQNLSTVSVVCSASGPEDELEKWRLSGVECTGCPIYMVYIASVYLAIAWNQILKRFIIHFYNLQTDLKTPPSR